MELKHRLKLAIALKYQHHEDAAPLVLASGKGELAEALLKKAEIYGIPVHPDAGLAQMLSEAKVGESIPEELFAVVAQILAMIYKMDKRLQSSLT